MAKVRPSLSLFDMDAESDELFTATPEVLSDAPASPKSEFASAVEKAFGPKTRANSKKQEEEIPATSVTHNSKNTKKSEVQRSREGELKACQIFLDPNVHTRLRYMSSLNKCTISETITTALQIYWEQERERIMEDMFGES